MMMKQWKSLCKVCKDFRQGGNRISMLEPSV